MRILGTIVFCLGLAASVNAQNEDLMKRVEAIEDSVVELRQRVDAIRKIAAEYGHSHPEKMQFLGEYIVSMAYGSNDRWILGRGHELIGSSNIYRDFPAAISDLLKAIEIFEELNDQYWLSSCYAGLALVYQSMNEKENAVNAINKSALYARTSGDSSLLSRIFTNKSSIHYHFKNIDSALHNGKIALEYKRALNQKSGVNLMLLNMGIIMADYDSLLAESESFMLEAKEMAGTEGIMISDVVANMIYISYRKNDLKSCYAYIDSAEWACDSVDNDYTLQAVHRMAQEIYGEFGEMDKAYEHLMKEYELEKQLRGVEVQKKFEVLELNFENEKSMRQIAILEKEQAETQFRYTVAILTAIILLILGILVYVITKRNAQIRERSLKLEIEHKKRELASYAINFVQKNTLFSELKERLTELHKKHADAGSEIKSIQRVIDDNYRADKEWENFKLRFEEVHQDFFPTLTRKFPDLGGAEIKLCALLRLNLNLKESSNILGISPDSVKTARHRLRKKLNLNTEDNLVQYLASIA